MSERILIRIQESEPDAAEAKAFIGHDEAGAQNIFIGTTRNHHEGKSVTKLFYDCYDEMAAPELRRIAENMMEKYSLKKIYLVHRTGLVPVGEASIILAISAAHRKDVFDATAEAMNLIKKDVPIWKKESYGDEDVWREELVLKDKKFEA